MGICNAKAPVGLLLGLVCVLGFVCMAGNYASAEEVVDDPVLGLVVDLLHDPDPSMRTLGLQQIRDELPGEAATKTLAAMVPDLPPEVRAELLDALGVRGDVAAKPAVLTAVNDENENVRIAALRALGALGSAEDVATLVTELASENSAIVEAAREGLIRLHGDGVDVAIAKIPAEAAPALRVRLMEVLATRGAQEAIPAVLESTKDPDASVRIAALAALRVLADENQAAALVKAVKATEDEREQRAAEMALLAVCRPGSEPCVDAILADLDDADTAAKIALLHALARCGGPKALAEVGDRLDDGDPAVRAEAMRQLAIWPDPAAIEPLREIAENSDEVRKQVLALRGLVRLGSPAGEKPADVELLAEALGLAKRPQEKQLVIGMLGNAATADAIAVLSPILEDTELAKNQPELVEDAALATVAVAERIVEAGGDLASAKAALNQVVKVAKNDSVRQRARAVLDKP